MRIELFNNLLITCARQPVLTVNTNRPAVAARLSPAERRVRATARATGISLVCRNPANPRRAPIFANCCITCAGRCLPNAATWRRTTTACSGAATLPVRSTSWNSMPPWQRAADAAKRGDADRERAALEEAARLYQDDLLRSLLRRLAPTEARTLPPPAGTCAQPPDDPARKPAATIPRPYATPNGWWHWIRWPRRTTRR